MRSSVVCEPMSGRPKRGRRPGSIHKALGAIAVVGLLAQHRLAVAQSCTVPTLNDNVCAGRGGTIDDYIACYRDLYDQNVIPAFRAVAECTHLKATNGIQSGLETVAALVTSVVKSSLADIDHVIDAQGSAPNTCIADLNAVEATLRPFLDAERAAPDLDAYRRAHYTPGHFTFFEDVLLTARRGRAACDGSLQALRKRLVLLSELKVNHLDYCEVIRQSASYDSVSHIEGLAQWTAVDPKINFNSYFSLSITLNSQCGYYDFSGGGQANVRYATCPTLTTEYGQTLTGVDGTLGWLAKNRNTIVPVSTAIAAAVFSAAGYGAAAGPYGALVGAGVGLVIWGLEYLALQSAIDELEDLIADKEQTIKNVVANNLITESEYAGVVTALCTPWQLTVESRVQDMLRTFDVTKHLQTVDGYYVLSDRLNDWYNELFLWAITPGPSGTRFIDELARQDLLAQKDQFDQRIFAARAAQEAADRRNTLTNIKATVTLLGCSNLSASQKRIVKSQLNVGVIGFNHACLNTMDAVAVQPDQPVAFADGSVTSTVTCTYNGFRSGVASLEIRNGEGFASQLTLKDSAGAVLAQLRNVTSDTDFAQAGVPGFLCASDVGQEFGKSAASRLAPATYALHTQDNLFGFRSSDAAALRTDVQSLDAQLRFKTIVCARQLGATFDTPRTADACGIPTVR